MKNNPHSINKELAAFILTILLIIILMMCFVSSFGQTFSSLRARTDSIYYKSKVDSMAIWATVDSMRESSLDSVVKHTFGELKPMKGTVHPVNTFDIPARIKATTIEDAIIRPQGRIIVHVKTVKIGTIEIDEDEAKEYFKDCYEHGDTVFIKTWIDYAQWGATYSKKEVATLSAMAREYNDRLRKEGRFLGDGIFVMVRMPSEQDYIKWLHNRK